MTPQELHDAIRLLTTDQREWVEFYQESIRGDELPLGTRIRFIDPEMPFWFGKIGTIIAYHQPARGWAEWYWVHFDGDPERAIGDGPKIHRSKFEVIG